MVLQQQTHRVVVAVGQVVQMEMVLPVLTLLPRREPAVLEEEEMVVVPAGKYQ